MLASLVSFAGDVENHVLRRLQRRRRGVSGGWQTAIVPMRSARDSPGRLGRYFCPRPQRAICRSPRLDRWNKLAILRRPGTSRDTRVSRQTAKSCSQFIVGHYRQAGQLSDCKVSAGRSRYACVLGRRSGHQEERRAGLNQPVRPQSIASGGKGFLFTLDPQLERRAALADAAKADDLHA